jgi:hypothetical protein
MSASGKTISNQWMIDLANSARKEVGEWPAWKREGFGVVTQSNGGQQSSTSTKKNPRKVA